MPGILKEVHLFSLSNRFGRQVRAKEKEEKKVQQ